MRADRYLRELRQSKYDEPKEFKVLLL